MARFIVRGGNPISGMFVPAGNKNAALPMLAASVLTDDPVVLTNLPQIEDVQAMLEMLDSLGVEINRHGRSVTLRAANLRRNSLGPALCRRARSSILFAGPMSAARGGVTLSLPGGDSIGRRRLDTHFLALSALGIQVHPGPDQLYFKPAHLRAANILLDEASVTATENALMAAVLAPGRTEIFNAACEPHVRELGLLLTKMGAKIEGLGTNRIRITGVQRLRGARHAIASDHIEAGSFAVAAAVTGGALSVSRLVPGTIRPLLTPLRTIGIQLRHDKTSLRSGPQSVLVVESKYGRAVPKIEDGVWPNFPSDMMSVAIVAATQSKGTLLFFEKMFESRMYFVDRLIEMGANIIQCDPHRVLVTGPARLRAGHVSSPDIRAGMAMIIAALCARGESIIENAQVVDRGYERIDERLRALGANIERED